MQLLFQQIVSGLAAGGLYALMTLGLVIIFRATRVANFGHGEMAMLSTFVAYFLFTTFHLPIAIAVIGAVLFAVAVGIGLERLAVRPLLKGPMASVLMSTLAIYIIVHESAFHIWGGDLYVFPPFFSEKPVQLFNLIISQEHIGIISVSFGLMLALYFLFQHTKVGLAMRAMAQDRTVAVLLGIRLRRMYAATWALGSGLGAVTGILFAPVISLYVDYMEVFIIKAFIVMVLGGLDSFAGVVIAGLSLGVMENIIAGYVSSEFRDALSLILVILVMLVRPSGLLGTVEIQKV